MSGPIASLRHDLRAPINAIIGYAEMLLEDRVPDSPQAISLAEIVRAGRELDRLVTRSLAEPLAAAVTAATFAPFDGPLTRVVEACGALAGRASAADAPDLERILLAAERMRRLVGEAMVRVGGGR